MVINFLKTSSGQDIGTHYAYVVATTREGYPGSTGYSGEDEYQAYDTHKSLLCV